ncbi:hypothetical protein ACHAWC_001991 [Mediolabrus comicus]
MEDNQQQPPTAAAADEELANSTGINALSHSSSFAGHLLKGVVDNVVDSARESETSRPKTWQEHTSRQYALSIGLGISMAFSAGYANGVCLSGFLNVDPEGSVKQSVAGVTGLYTNSAIFIGEREFHQASFMFGTIFSVMGGAFLSALLNPYPIAFEISPRYGLTFLMASFFMTLGAIEVLHNDRREFYFTAIANGIQNGVSSMYSANLLRTSHLTGTTTDIGLFLGMALRGNRTNNWKLYILIGLAVSFWLGSISGFLASQVKYEYSLIFNAVFFFLLSIVVIARTCIVYQVSPLNALLGTGKWMDSLDHLEIVKDNGGESDDGSAADDKDKRNHLDEGELHQMFDEIASGGDGNVDQQTLLAYLTTHNLKVQKHRKPLVAVLHNAFVAHGDGDWKLSKDDWNALIHQSTKTSAMETNTRRSSMMTMHASKKSILKSSRHLSMNNETASAAALSGPELLRRASIIQLGAALDAKELERD